MSRIRGDVVGVFHTAKGILKAGDDVPDGVVIHERFLEKGPLALEPKANASKADWQAFLESQGILFPEGAKRNELRDIWEDTQ